MNRDKLNKEANNHAKIMGDVPEINSTHAFKAGAEWLQSQPLRERLTDDEKEKIRGFYNRKITYTSEMAKKYAEVDLLVAIFGIDFFEREK